MTEHQNLEYKESWRDEHLKSVCGFANAKGGRIIIGVNDKGQFIGTDQPHRLLEDIPNKIADHLGLLVDVNLLVQDDMHCIEINVPPSDVPISFRGIYHYRMGSTKRELKGIALNKFLLKKMGLSWEEKPIPNATLDDIDESVVRSFVQKAVSHERISPAAANTDTLTLLKNLELMNESGEFLLAALLLFGKKPKKYEFSAFYKIGRFGKSHSDLLFQDIVEGNIFEMADKVMEVLNKKYLIRPISYKGLLREEPLEYPEPALREAILNSIIHKDYSGTMVFLRIYDDELSIWNPGELPESMTIEKLLGTHGSEPRNRLIANVFFMAGYIESWGRGINIMMNACKQAGLPAPQIAEEQCGMRVTFLKDPYTKERLKFLGLNVRQIKAVQYLKEHGQIDNAIYQNLTGVSSRTALRDFQVLIEKQLIKKIGTVGTEVFYTLK